MFLKGYVHGLRAFYILSFYETTSEELPEEIPARKCVKTNTVYVVFQQSRMQYGVAFWGGTSAYALNALEVLPKTTVRIINRKKKYIFATPYYEHLSILPLSLLFEKQAVLFNITYCLEEQILGFSTLTRLAARGVFKLTNLRKVHSRNQLTYKGVDLVSLLMDGEEELLDAISKFRNKEISLGVTKTSPKEIYIRNLSQISD